jgi:MFS family permease
MLNPLRKSSLKSAVRPGLVLLTCCLSLLLVMMDTTIVNVAMPTIGRDLHASTTGLQWIIDAYTIVLATSRRKIGWLWPEFRITSLAENCKARRFEVDSISCR